jgi:branched-chain amino acid transport system substrate-binding protein
MNTTTKYLKIAACIMMFSLLMTFPLAAHSKDKIRIGQAVSLSGPNAIIHMAGAFVPQTLWVDQVNAKGGIYVKEYGKKLPVEWIQYDDKSDHGTMVKLIEKLILEDKVDLLLPP